MKISSTVCSPEGPRVFMQLASTTSWLWLGHGLPSDSALVQHGTMSRSGPSVLICSAQRCLFGTVPMSSCQLHCQETGTRQSGFREIGKAEARERACALEGRMEVVDWNPSRVPHPPSHFPKDLHHQHPQGYQPFLCFPNFI